MFYVYMIYLYIDICFYVFIFLVIFLVILYMIAVLFSANYLVSLNNIYIYIFPIVLFSAIFSGACPPDFLNTNVEDFLVVF